MAFAELAQTLDLPKIEQSRFPLANLANLPYSRREIDGWYKEMDSIYSLDKNIKLDLYEPSPLENFNKRQYIQKDIYERTEFIRQLRDYFTDRQAKHKGYLTTANSNGNFNF